MDKLQNYSPPGISDTQLTSWKQREPFLTVGVLQRVACFLTPPYGVQVGAVGLHPVVVLGTPAVKMDLEGKVADCVNSG